MVRRSTRSATAKPVTPIVITDDDDDTNSLEQSLAVEQVEDALRAQNQEEVTEDDQFEYNDKYEQQEDDEFKEDDYDDVDIDAINILQSSDGEEEVIAKKQKSNKGKGKATASKRTSTQTIDVCAHIEVIRLH